MIHLGLALFKAAFIRNATSIACGPAEPLCRLWQLLSLRLHLYEQRLKTTRVGVIRDLVRWRPPHTKVRFSEVFTFVPLYSLSSGFTCRIKEVVSDLKGSSWMCSFPPFLSSSCVYLVQELTLLLFFFFLSLLLVPHFILSSFFHLSLNEQSLYLFILYWEFPVFWAVS